MREHIYEVDNGNVKRRLQSAYLFGNLFAEVALVNLVIGKAIAFAESVQLVLNEFFLVKVLAFLLFFSNPEVGVHLPYLFGHQSCKDSVTRVLGSRRQDGAIDLLFVNAEDFVEQRLDGLPLVIAEVVNHDKEDFLPFIEQGEYLPLEDVRRKQRAVGSVAGKPRFVVADDPFRPRGVSLFALLEQHIAHRRLHVLQLQIPAIERLMDAYELLERARRVNHIGYVGKLFAVRLVRLFSHELAALDMLLEAKQYLVGVDRFDEVVGNLLTYGLLHYILLFALGNHHHGRFGVQPFEFL